MKKIDTQKSGETRLGYIGLSALVFGMMVGAGIFNIPQNMAAGAGPGAVMVAWGITAAGMLLLVATFKSLADSHPSLDAGIYQYAAEGYGPFSGFLTAWGYWLCTCFANVAYAVMLNDTVGAFFPRLLDHGWPTVAFGSVFIWGICLVVMAGLRTAKIITTIMAAVKMLAIALIAVLLFANLKAGMFTADFWGHSGGVGPLLEQVKSTMLVTLWCFIGIEGAVMMAGRARRSSDVGKAGITGFLAAWLLYVLVSLSSFGVMGRAELAGLENPSVAYLLDSVCGPWAYYMVIGAVILSLTGGWAAWTLVCAEVPYTAARTGLLSRRFMKLNSHGTPARGLVVSSVVMQLFLLLVVTADDVYLTALNITGMMILPAYLVSGLFLWKAERKWTGLLCAAFCAWMIYAGGLTLLMQTSVFYLAGLGFYVTSRRRAGLFPLRRDKWLLAILLACACASALLSFVD